MRKVYTTGRIGRCVGIDDANDDDDDDENVGEVDVESPSLRKLSGRVKTPVRAFLHLLVTSHHC